MEWQQLVSRWAADPFVFVVEALFHMKLEDWTPWAPGTPRPDPLPRGPDLWQAALLRGVAAA